MADWPQINPEVLDALVAERNALRARLAAVEAERDLAQRRVDALLSRAETAERSQALMIEHRVELNDALHEARAHAEAAEDRLAAVLAVPACRDAGHVETLHSVAGCCDPYETPCAAYTASMRATARGEGDRPAAEPPGTYSCCRCCKGDQHSSDHSARCPKCDQEDIARSPSPRRLSSRPAVPPPNRLLQVTLDDSPPVPLSGGSDRG